MKTGCVFDIKEFAVFDGPGIRTTVFMKGCPLRCRWCHNPEGLSIGKQLMVSVASCARCGKCEAVCPHPGHCEACGACVPACPGGLRRVVGSDWTADALAQRLLKDRDVYEMSGGGVTFSGGEPLMQWEFVKSVIDRLPGIHTAIETSGYSADDVFRSAVQTCSLIMMDWKLSDPALHETFTGVSQAPIRRHLETLAAGDTPFIVRMPVIPGVNDNRAHFETTANLLSGAKRLVRVELLPYQRAAGAKYAMVGKRYEPGFDEEKIPQFFAECFESRGISVQKFR